MDWTRQQTEQWKPLQSQRPTTQKARSAGRCTAARKWKGSRLEMRRCQSQRTWCCICSSPNGWRSRSPRFLACLQKTCWSVRCLSKEQWTRKQVKYVKENLFFSANLPATLWQVTFLQAKVALRPCSISVAQSLQGFGVQADKAFIDQYKIWLPILPLCPHSAFF